MKIVIIAICVLLLFGNGIALCLGNATFIHTYITNSNSISNAFVPESDSLVLLGTGLLVLAIYGKRRMNKE